MESRLDFQSELVISGISGRYPQSDDLNEFWQNLIEGKDMITEHNRYNNLGLEIPNRMGVIKNLEKFDADFFTIHAKQSNVLDPRLRKLLEVTHEAIVDAGISPTKLHGTNTGVFVAASDSEAAPIWKRSNSKTNVYGVLGNAYSMLANRLSYSFGLNGPSYVLDTACSASSTAIQQAILSIRNGICDAAIVAGAHLHHDAIASFMFSSLEMTSKDCKCKSFDAAADGYARAESVVAIFICKKQVAKRSYATLVHATINNDGYKEQGITFPSEETQERVMRKLYEDIGMDPREVDYVEAHGTGTRVGDPEELIAVSKVFCEGRNTPLLVGSVKSNMGHPEPVAGLCAMSKIILSNLMGTIPGNLHYKNPNPEIPSLHDGRIEIVGHNQPFVSKYVGINSMGFGGTNVHILLKFDNEANLPPKPESPTVPIIYLASGRTEESVKYYLEKSMERIDPHFIKLIHEIAKDSIPKHPFRGYTITGTECPPIQIDTIDQDRAVWYVFTGLGSQWVGMSRDLVKFDAFKNSIERSVRCFDTTDFDLLGLLNSGESKLFDNFKNAVISITSIQVALVDLLRNVGIYHDGIIGHSTGEVAAGYADGCLTHEQAVHVSNARVRAVLESGCPPGTVASVGLTWEDAQKRCPKGIYPAIHNAKENVTIAGSPEDVKAFVKQLESEGVFAKMVRSADFGFHSPLVEKSGPVAYKILEEVIPEPKLRSNKWLSSSVPEHLWGTDLAKYCSPAYYVNNGVSPVYFYTTLLHVPENVVVLEIAPHCFMQSILKQSLPKNAVKVGLIHVKSPDNCQYFLNALGTCYLSGLNFDASKLYDPVEFPVNSRTPNISSLIRWDHTENWYVPHNGDEQSKQQGKRYFINIQSEIDSYLEGHSLEGKIVFPATGYLWLVWRHFAEEQALSVEACPIVFEHVRFERITLLSKRSDNAFYINVLHNSGKFEVHESDMIVCSGYIRNVEGRTSEEMLNPENCEDVDISGPFMTKGDFYKEIHLRGYGHSGNFQGIQEIDMESNWAKIEWTGHWVTFLDSIVQTYMLRNLTRDLFVPTTIEKLTVDPIEVRNYLNKNDNQLIVKARPVLQTGSCHGIEILNLGFAKFNQKQMEIIPTTTEQVFIPYLAPNSLVLPEENALESCTEITIDNSSTSKFVFTEILMNAQNMISHHLIRQCLLAFPSVDFATVNETGSGLGNEEGLKQSGTKLISFDEMSGREKSNLIFIDNEKRISEIGKFLLPGGFILYEGSYQNLVGSDLALISKKRFIDASNQIITFLLFRKFIIPTASKISVITVDASNFDWVQSTKDVLKKSDEFERIIFVSSSKKSGIVGFIKSLVKEVGADQIRCFQTISRLPLDFDKPSKTLEEQFSKDLLFNIYKNNVWGYYGNQVIPTEEFQKQKLASNVYANALKLGELASLSWIESPLKHSKVQNLIEVHYSALNFKDVMLATGRISTDALVGPALPNDCVLGLEFSGKFKGKRVFGMATSRCLATYVNPTNVIVFDIPNHWSYEEAATVPAVYVTVYLALIIRGKIKRGESILIHAGSGGVGQAAIAVALSMNCKVFTTVSTQEKRDFLKNRFPSLTDESFANSRDANDFERHIKLQTKGRGVDLVLNCLAQEKLHASIKCLAKNGRFLEIGKFDLLQNTNIGLGILLKGVSIIGILADAIYEGDSSEDQYALKGLMEEGMRSGVVTPINYTIFKSDQLEEAFRYMAQGKHIGKVLIRIKEAENILASIPAYPRTYFHNQKSYLIIGGLGGMGFEVANWMTLRGAKNLVLSSRSGVKSSYHEHQIEQWEKRGVTVVIDKSDASTIEGAKHLLTTAMKLGPVGGIFNTAVVLKDGLFDNQTVETFEESARCKADATSHFDMLSRQFASELDYFVVFSSIVAARGNPGQTNYGYSNSVMERICEQRKSDGLPAIAIQWGAVGDVGVVHRQMKEKPSFSGLIPQRLQSCLETLDLYLQQDKPVVSSFLVIQKGDVASLNSSDSLVDTAARILGIKDISKINHKTTLVDLGMDSLMAAELGQVLTTRKNIQISAKSYAQLTFEKLSKFDKQGGGSEENSAGNSLPKIEKLLTMRSLRNEPVFKMNSLALSTEIIFIVHPIDGTLQTLETLVGQMEAQVYGIEYVKEAPSDNIQNLAEFYLKKVREIQPRGPYRLGGYSFGSNVAFEMALQLEMQNEKVLLLLLMDGSPKWKDVVVNLQGGDEKRQEWENLILFSFLRHYTSEATLSTLKELSDLQSLEDKCDCMTKVLSLSYTNMNVQEIREFVTSYLARIEMVKIYEVSTKVKAKTVLLKALQAGTEGSIAFDYGLSDVCEEPVEVVEIEGNHYCFYEKPIELSIPAIVNKIVKQYSL